MTAIRVRIAAPRSAVFAALLDPELVAQWKVPHNMACVIHEWNPFPGGTFRVSLTYRDGSLGKTAEHTDTYHGRFSRITDNDEVADEIEFETTDPAMQGVMTSSMTLRDVDGGTELTAVHGNLPPGLSEDLNLIGWRDALARLTMIVERSSEPG